jgi:hypothetical protein
LAQRTVEVTGRDGGDPFIIPEGAYFKQIAY